MIDRFAHLQWPFFDAPHADLARTVDAWAAKSLGDAHDDDADAVCRRLVKELGAAGYLRHCVNDAPDVRSIALIREVLAYHAGLADFAFAMQGLGSGSIVLAGNPAQKQRYLPRAAAGEAIASGLGKPSIGGSSCRGGAHRSLPSGARSSSARRPTSPARQSRARPRPRPPRCSACAAPSSPAAAARCTTSQAARDPSGVTRGTRFPRSSGPLSQARRPEVRRATICSARWARSSEPPSSSRVSPTRKSDSPAAG